MAQGKKATSTENDSGFLLIRKDDTPECATTFKGWFCDQPGVLIKKIIETKDESGAVVATETMFDFKPGAAIREHCVDDQITSGDLVGGEL